MTSTYFTVVIPFVAKNATEWHPTSPVGPLSTLTRGAFATEAEADKWAAERLAGHPYTLRACESGE